MVLEMRLQQLRVDCPNHNSLDQPLRPCMASHQRMTLKDGIKCSIATGDEYIMKRQAEFSELLNFHTVMRRVLVFA